MSVKNFEQIVELDRKKVGKIAILCEEKPNLLSQKD